EITAAYIANGTASGEMTDGSTYDADEFIHFEHNNRGKRFKLKGLFSGNTVDLRNLIIRANDYQTVIDARNIQGVESTHTIYIPNSINSGAYICPNAYTLEDISSSCSGKITFSYAEANSGTWKSGIFAEIEGSNYKISNLTGSGGSEYTPSCGDSITVNTTLAAGLTNCTGHGLTIGAHNIVLDCQGNTIDGDKTDARYGIVTSGKDNIVIKNCIITQFDRGINDWNQNIGNLIFNNTFHDFNDYGILFGSTTNTGNNISGNTIYNTGTEEGIYFKGEDTIIENNIVYDIADNGIFIQSSSNLTIENNFAYNCQGEGLTILSTTDSIISNNNVTNNGLEGGYSSNFLLATDTTDNIFENNRIIGGQRFGLRTYSSVSGNIFRNNVIANSSDDLLKFGDGSGGDCNNNLFINNSFESNGSFNSLASIGYANNNSFIDTTFTGSGNHLYFSNDGDNTTFLNSTFDSWTWDTPGIHNVYRKWYLDVHVNLSNSSNLENANVTAYDNVPTEIFSELTNSSGRTSRYNLTEYMYDGSTYTYYTNYTLNTTHTVYGADTSLVNLTTNKLVSITLALNTAPDTQNVTLTSDDAQNRTNGNLTGSFDYYDADGDPQSNNETKWYKDGVLQEQIERSNFVYSYSGNPTNPLNGVDKDWDTYTHVGTQRDATFLINYTKPLGIQSANWKINYSDGTEVFTASCLNSSGWQDLEYDVLPVADTKNKTVLDSCFDYSETLQLKVYLSADKTITIQNTFYDQSILWNYANSTILDDMFTSKDDAWIFSARVNDGSEWSPWVNSSTLTILNTAPTTPTQNSPASGATIEEDSTLINCSGSTDADSDAITYHYYGDSADGSTYLGTNNSGTTYNWTSLSDNTDYYWKCLAGDGEENSSTTGIRNFSITINDAPVTISGRISPTTTYTNDTLIGYCNATDIDADTIQYYYKWYKDGVLNLSGNDSGGNAQGVETNVNNLSSSSTAKEEEWILSCLANDGEYNSSWLNSSTLTILNTAPTTPSSVILNDTTLYTDDSVECTASGSTDADSDAITYYYKFNDTAGTLQDWSTTNAFDCSTAGCDKGDTLYCHAKATTSDANSTILSNSTTILNTAPTTPTQNSPASGATIEEDST
ncbi:MAG: hypothetical protein HN967_13090, partial [Candidatus Marinimicrobia bacterium]|nr:hypothetical protein [Candidatus Neomarinimicrobiota bacterium]